MMNFFGYIDNEKMVLNKCGWIVFEIWNQLPQMYKNVILDYWTIMPNHIHGIIVIENISVGAEHRSARKTPDNPARKNVINRRVKCATNERVERVENERVKRVVNKRAERCSAPTTNMNRNYGLVSKIVKSFKNECTKQIHSKFKNYNFAWQRSFHDHVIRDEKSLDNIRHYIKNNPGNWGCDRNNLL